MQESVERGFQSTPFFCKTFLPVAFKNPFNDFQLQAWDLFDDDTLPKTAVCGYRGIGKSAMCKGKAVKVVCYRQAKFILYVGQSLDYAKSQIEAIKFELIANRMITSTFGYMKAEKYEGVDLAFNKEGFYVCDPKTGEPFCFIGALGANQSPRGKNVYINGEYVRPDFVIIDDLESDEDVANEMTRKKIWTWLMGSLKEVTSEERPNPKTGLWDRDMNDPSWRPPWRFFYMDTYKHEDAAMAKLLEMPDWKSLRLPQGEPVYEEGTDKITGYRSLVPSISDRQLEVEALNAKNGGYIDTFYREKLCLAVSEENKSWTRSMFKYYRESDKVDRTLKTGLSYDSHVYRFLIVDPAKTSNPKSAYSSILGVAVDPIEQRIYARDLVCKHLDPVEVVEHMIDMAFALNTRMVWIENTGLEDWLEHLVRNECITRRVSLNLQYLDARARVAAGGDYGTGKDAAKRARASTIQPYYRQGYVVHADHLQQSALEQQMLSFPYCTYWDAIDCAGYIPKVMMELGIYWKAKDGQMDERWNLKFDDTGRMSREELRDAIKRGEYQVCS